MKLMLYYLFKTSLEQKKQDWREYDGLRAVVKSAKLDLEKARHNITKVQNGPENVNACVTYHVWYDMIMKHVRVYESVCKRFRGCSRFCNEKCPFYARKQEYLKAFNHYSNMKSQQSDFWQTKMQQVI